MLSANWVRREPIIIGTSYKNHLTSITLYPTVTDNDNVRRTRGRSRPAAKELLILDTTLGVTPFTPIRFRGAMMAERIIDHVYLVAIL